MSCGATCAKFLLQFFNILFWLAGCVLLGVSIWILVDQDAWSYLRVATLGSSEDLIKSAAITLCVIGSVVFLIAFLGCCGAMKENVCMLNTYATIVIILLAGQIAAGILAVVYKDELLGGLSETMNTTVTTQYGQDGYSVETEAWDLMQISFKCCGVKEPYSEWAVSKWREQSGNDVVPDTCCVLVDDKATDPIPVNRTACNIAAQTHSNDDAYYHYQGCYDSMYNWAVNHSAILIGVAFGLAGLQILVLTLACCVSTNTKKDNYQKM